MCKNFVGPVPSVRWFAPFPARRRVASHTSGAFMKSGLSSSITESLSHSLLVFAFAALSLAGVAACKDETCVGNSCLCEAGKTCDVGCDTAGGCNQQCDGTCTFTCKAGDCPQQASSGSNLTASCAGGRCLQQCVVGATCKFSCEGGSCAQSCLGSTTCTTSCAGGTCTTD
jgi:hypothetical protein